MMETQCCDAGVVDHATPRLCRTSHSFKMDEIAVAFRQHGDLRQRDQITHLGQCMDGRCRRLEDAGIGDDRHEFVNTGPGNRPSAHFACQPIDHVARGAMEWRVGSICQTKRLVSTAITMDLVAHLFPCGVAKLGRQAVSIEGLHPQSRRLFPFTSTQCQAQAFFDQRLQSGALAARHVATSLKQIIRDFNSRFHMGDPYQLDG